MEKSKCVWNQDLSFIGSSRSSTRDHLRFKGDSRDHDEDNNNNNNIIIIGEVGGEHHLVNAFAWPPRSYTCAFCKREFRSAQALGGHMNVHRRDRARLKQMSSYSTALFKFKLNLQPNPNNNSNPNFSSHLSPGLAFSSHSSIRKFHGINNIPSENEGKVATDLEIGLLGGSKSDDLDLELRLGCA